MDGVQVKRNKVRIPIMDGDTQLGEIIFNPDDDSLYKKIVELMQKACRGATTEKEAESKFEEIERLPDELDSIEDFEKASRIFNDAGKAIDMSIQAFDELYNGLNGAFGNGKDICYLFTDGDKDPELLSPLLDAVTPYFKKAREAKVSKYQAKK